MEEPIEYLPYGDSGLLIKIGHEISEEINKEVLKLSKCIEENKIIGIIDIVSAYNSILVLYNPLIISFKNIINTIKEIKEEANLSSKKISRVFHIPTIYGDKYGIDLQTVADYNNLTTKEVIKIHSQVFYRVYMLGFAPGFPYLGGMSNKISTPRKKTPRNKIYEGSVGIGGNQTGIYTVDSPGGWQIIGKTPIRFFDIETSKPLLEAGDLIKFEVIEKEHYNLIKDQVLKGTYKIKVSLREEKI